MCPDCRSHRHQCVLSPAPQPSAVLTGQPNGRKVVNSNESNDQITFFYEIKVLISMNETVKFSFLKIKQKLQLTFMFLRIFFFS